MEFPVHVLTNLTNFSNLSYFIVTFYLQLKSKSSPVRFVAINHLAFITAWLPAKDAKGFFDAHRAQWWIISVRGISSVLLIELIGTDVSIVDFKRWEYFICLKLLIYCCRNYVRFLKNFSFIRPLAFIKGNFFAFFFSSIRISLKIFPIEKKIFNTIL